MDEDDRELLIRTTAFSNYLEALRSESDRLLDILDRQHSISEHIANRYGLLRLELISRDHSFGDLKEITDIHDTAELTHLAYEMKYAREVLQNMLEAEDAEEARLSALREVKKERERAKENNRSRQEGSTFTAEEVAQIDVELTKLENQLIDEISRSSKLGEGRTRVLNAIAGDIADLKEASKTVPRKVWKERLITFAMGVIFFLASTDGRNQVFQSLEILSMICYQTSIQADAVPPPKEAKELLGQ